MSKEQRTKRKVEFVNQEMAAIEDGKEITKKGYLSLLTSMKGIEDELDKDLSEFNATEILNYYKGRSWTSYDFISMKNYMLMHYTDWCIANHETSATTNYYAEINDKDILMSCLNSIRMEAKWIKREQILKDFELVPNYSDQFIVLGVYEGIGSKNRNEFGELYIEQFEGNTLHLEDRDIEVSSELIEIAKKSASTYSLYAFYDGNPAEFGDSYADRGYREEDPTIVKARINSNKDTKNGYLRRVDMTLDRVVKVTGNPAYSFMSLRNSGKINYMKKFLETDPRCNSLATILKYHTDDITNKYGPLNINYLQGMKEIFKK